MLSRNIKQSIDALAIFTRLEDKIYSGECKIKCIYNSSFISNERIIDISNDNLDTISIRLNPDNHKLIIGGCLLPKSYVSELSDDEFDSVKKRFIKIVQMCQDNFENWLKDTDVNNGIDAE